MPDYIPYTSDEYQVEAPATALHFARWFQNWEAGFQGATGAPRLSGNAVATLENGGLSILPVMAANTREVKFGAGQVVVSLTGSSTNPTAAVTYTISHYTGSMRFKATHGSGGAGYAYLYLYKNNVLVSSFITYASAARVVDVSIIPGDVVEWRHAMQTGGSPTILSNVGVFATDAYYEIIPVSKFSGA